MTNYQAGEIVLMTFPFTSGGLTKNRPALVILDTGNSDLLVARVTTQPYHTPYDVEITDWQTPGLLAPSGVRLHKLATLAKSRVLKQPGQLGAADRQSVGNALQQIAAAW